MALHHVTSVVVIVAGAAIVGLGYLRIAALMGRAMETPDDDEMAEAARRARYEAMRPDQVHADDDGCGR